MPTIDFIEYEEASPELRQVYDDIIPTRNIDIEDTFPVIPGRPIYSIPDPERIFQHPETPSHIFRFGHI